MDLRELARQEDLIGVIQRTMQPVWADQLRTPVRVSSVRLDASSQPWRMNSRLAAFFSEDVSAAPRRFMADRFRFTPNWRRLPFQWSYGTYLASRRRLRTSQVGFFVTPGLPNASNILVVPGSRRIRTFNFLSRTTRSYLKQGYCRAATTREIEVRGSGAGPFTPILAKSPQNAWFEEEILPGYVFPRIPPWWNRAAIEAALLVQIAEWLKHRSISADPDQYFAGLHAAVSDGLARFVHQYPAHAAVIDLALVRSLEACLNRDSLLRLTQSHGDLQPGNVHLTPSQQVYFLDWEFSSLRHYNYDFLTYGLGARQPIGFARRVQRFVTTGEAGGSTPFIERRATAEGRMQIVSLYLLEEISRATQACVSSPFTAPPQGYLNLWRELTQLVLLRESG